VQILDLLAEDDRLNVYAGELEVRPPGAPTTRRRTPDTGRGRSLADVFPTARLTTQAASQAILLNAIDRVHSRARNMDPWFNVIAAASEFSADSVKELDEVGFVVIPGPVAPPQLSRLRAVYDAAVSAADPADFNSGRTTTRVSDFVNRAPDFDALYIYQPILEACCRVIGAPFHLSTMHARAVNPGAPAQDLHADYQRTADGWPMVGFIFMVDEFRRENGATRFVPRSQRWGHAPSDVMQDATADYEGQVSACGPAGSVVIYNGSVWHGHGAN
jgi:Phytanoyl-CoA dioxygenase (PhyH)